VPDTHEPIVTSEIFELAQKEKAKRVEVETEDALAGLRALLLREGYLSYDLITRTKGLPNAKTYAARFGSLANAYRSVGFEPKQDFVVQRRLWRELADLVGSSLSARGRMIKTDRKARRITVDGSVEIALTISCCWIDSRAEKHWQLRYPNGPKPAFLICGRRRPDGDELQDFCVVRLDDQKWNALSLDEIGSQLSSAPFAESRLSADLNELLDEYI
jgi:hypothetical protein